MPKKQKTAQKPVTAVSNKNTTETPQRTKGTTEDTEEWKRVVPAQRP
jgi:hypothetical protein